MSQFTLSYVGRDASRGEIDFYDVARAMLGFQRSLALTMHLVQNGEIITQANALKNGRILVAPPRDGSWEIVAGAIFAATAGGMALAPRDSRAGKLTRKVYDYVLRSVMGEDVDFDDSFNGDFEAEVSTKVISESKLDSLIEKAETGIVDMHRPIVWSETAQRGRIYFEGSKDNRVGPALSPETYEHATRTTEIKTPEIFEGIISSYNSNTFKGRIYLVDERRPVPFELAEESRGRPVVDRVTASLRTNALDRRNRSSDVAFKAFRRESSTGRLKSLWVVQVTPSSEAL